MEIKKGDIVIIKGSAEEQMYKGQKFEVVSDPYVICGHEVAKIKCLSQGVQRNAAEKIALLAQIELKSTQTEKGDKK